MTATTVKIDDENPRVEYTASGAQTIFDFPFPFFDANDVIVYLTLDGAVPSDLLDLQTINTEYTVQNVGTEDLGTVTFIVAPPLDSTIIIIRRLPIERQIDFNNSGDLLADTLNLDQDEQTMTEQDLRQSILRSMVLPDTGIDGSSFYDATGNKIINLGAGSEDTDAANLANVRALIIELSAGGDLNSSISGASTVATMVAFTKSLLVDLQIVYVSGRLTSGDGGGGHFFWSAASTATEDSGTVFASSGGGTGRWLRVTSSPAYLQWFGTVGDGLVNDTVALQAAIDYASASSVDLADVGGDYLYTSLEWKSNVYLTGVSDEASRLVLSGAISPSIFNTGTITNFGISKFGVGGNFFLAKTPGSGLNSSTFGDVVPCANLNAYYHTWRRTQAREGSAAYPTPDVFVSPVPIFGDASSYDGTGGLRIYGPDGIFIKQFGTAGAGTMTRVVNNGTEREISRSDYHANFSVVAVAPVPNLFDMTVTGATTYNSTTMVLTVGAHVLNIGDYLWWEDADYDDGGAGVIIESTFQVTAITATTVSFTIVADTNFVSWNNFGTITDDPDNKGFLHIHDPALGTIRRSWIRFGTASNETFSRTPMQRLGGFVSARLKLRYNSGTADWIVRAFQNFGVGGDANTSTDLTTITLDTGTSEIQEFLIYAELPSLAGTTFGLGPFLQIGLTIGADTSDIDIFELSIFEGLNIPADSDSSYEKEKPVFQKLYNADKIGWLGEVTAGRFYGAFGSYSEQMYGTPTVSLIEDIETFNVVLSSLDQVSANGFRSQITDSAGTQNVGRYAALYESEYQIPTNGIPNP